MNEETRILLANNLKPEDYMIITDNFHKLDKEIERLEEYRKRIAKALSYIEENKYPINEYNCSCSGDTTPYYEYELCCDPRILKRMLKGDDK